MHDDIMSALRALSFVANSYRMSAAKSAATTLVHAGSVSYRVGHRLARKRAVSLHLTTMLQYRRPQLQEPDSVTGAVAVPISLATTFAQATPGQPAGRESMNAYGKGFEVGKPH